MADNEQLDQQPASPQATPGAQNASGTSSGRARLLIVVALFVAGIGGYLVWEAGADHQPPSITSKFACITEACGFEEARPLKVGESFPLHCPKCGKNSLYVSFACPQCGRPNVMDEMRGLPGPTKCSQCGTEIPHGE